MGKSTKGKYGEPWSSSLQDKDQPLLIFGFGGAMLFKRLATFCSVPVFRRAIACVNACDGMEDPEREIRELQDQAKGGWSFIEKLDRKVMQYVLVRDSRQNQTRLHLWNPHRQCWERAEPAGSIVQPGEACYEPTHFRALPFADDT